VTRSTSPSNQSSCGSQSRAPSEFTTADAYAFTRELEKLHPDNPDKQHRGRSATLKTKSASNFKFCATPASYCTSSVFSRVAGSRRRWALARQVDATNRVEMNDWLAPWR
jgi:hypothetical protein